MMEHPRTSSVATASSTTDNPGTNPTAPAPTPTANDNSATSSGNSATPSSIPDSTSATDATITTTTTTGAGVSNICKKNEESNPNGNVLNFSDNDSDSDVDMEVEDDENIANTINASSVSPSTDLTMGRDETDNDTTSNCNRNNSSNSDNTNNNNSNSSIMFKQFDSTTGQFLRGNDEDDSQRGVVTPANMLPQNQGNNQISTVTSNPTLLFPAPTPFATRANKINVNHLKANQVVVANIPPTLKILSNMKSRSYSVPTILHSSLKRLSTNNGIYTHPMGGNPHQIMKKKFSKNVNGSNNNSNENLNSSHRHHHHHHHHHNKSGTRNLPKNMMMPIFSSSTSNTNSNSSSSSNSSSPPVPLKNENNGNTGPLRSAIMFNQQHLISSSKKSNTNTNNSKITLDDRINYFQRQQSAKLNLLLPPINLQCLKEIDLQEIVKNPQLRHDIIFDPLLQFRPNLDGERGIKKRQISDLYWSDVENELIIYMNQPSLFNYNCTRLVPLFDTLRDILLTIVPQRESQQIMNILDTELNVQSLVKSGATWSNMNDLATWLAQLFKHHCAPMRDSWVDKMKLKFENAMDEQSITKLIDGFKLIFQILEAMKLDIANHQIRLLRSALLSNAVEFERQYFNSLMNGMTVSEIISPATANKPGNNKKLLLKSSLLWFRSKFDESSSTLRKEETANQKFNIPDVYRTTIKSIISLLSCRKMVREYPTALSFDHARLILLRADIRQLVCLLVCRLLFQQLVASDKDLAPEAKRYILTNYDNDKLQNEIISIITDEYGNCRWTKNTMSIAVHLCKVINDLTSEYESQKDSTDNNSRILPSRSTMNSDTTEPKRNFNSTNTLSSADSSKLPTLDNQKIQFAKSWLSKQTQPLSEIYGVLENRVFTTLENSIFDKSECTMDGRVKQDFVYLYNPITDATASGTNGNDLNASDASTDTLTDSNRTASSTCNEGQKLLPFRPVSTNSNTKGKGNGNIMAIADMEQFENIYRHLYTIINLHWSVFGSNYVDTLSDKVRNI